LNKNASSITRITTTISSSTKARLEIEEKLNALIGVPDGMQQKPPAPPAS
jgi:hypothetical protein